MPKGSESERARKSLLTSREGAPRRVSANRVKKKEQ